MKKKVAGILLGITMTTTLLTGCGEKTATEVATESALTEQAGNGEAEELPAEEEEQEPAIPVAILLQENTSREGMLDGSAFTDAFADKNYQPIVFYADQDLETQLKQLNEVLGQGISTFIIDPVDCYAFAETLKNAVEESEVKLKFFSFDDLIMDTNQLSYYVTFDRRSIGHQAAERIIKDFGLEKMEDGAEPITIEFLMGSLDDMSALFYYNGMMELLQPYMESGKLVCKSGKTSFQQTGILREDEMQAKKRLSEILKEFYPESAPDILVTGFDAAVCAVQKTLEDAGFLPGTENWPYLTGFGAQAEAVRDIAEGRVKFSMFLDRRTLVQKCVDMVDICLKGESLEVDNYEQYDNGVKIIGTNICDGQLIDVDNYQMLIDNGYYTEDEVEPLEMVEAPLEQNEDGEAENADPEAEEENVAEAMQKDEPEVSGTPAPENTPVVSPTPKV